MKHLCQRWNLMVEVGQLGCAHDSGAVLSQRIQMAPAAKRGPLEDCTSKGRQIFGDPLQMRDDKLDKRKRESADFRDVSAGEGLRTDDWSEPANLYSLLDGTADGAPSRVENAMSSCGDQVSMERLWHKYFKNPTEWRDNRNSKLQLKSPDFIHNATEEALWIDRWDTPQWVVEFLGRIPSSEDGGRSIRRGNTYAEYRTGDTASSRPPRRNQSSWAAILSRHTKSGHPRKALRVYQEMREGGYKPSSYTCVAALKACRILQDLRSAKRIHAEAVESGVELDGHVGNLLVDVYAKCGSLVDARDVFDTMSHRDVVSWNAIISAYAHMEDGEAALQLYAKMQQEGLACNHRTFVVALKACTCFAAAREGNWGGLEVVQQRCLEQVAAIHSHIVKTGSESDVFVGTTLVDAYSRCGSLADARLVFEKMQNRSVVSWNAMIWGYAQMEQGEVALQLYTRMQQEGVIPNDRTFVSALKACQSLPESEGGNEGDEAHLRQLWLDQVRAIHLNIVKHRYESDLYVGTMLVDMYAKCGNLVDARRVFEKMPRRNVVCWTAMILGYAQMEAGEVALQLYARMQQEGLVPNDRTFVGALKACSSLAVSEEGKNQCLEQVRGIHSQVFRRGFESDLFLGTMLVDVYAKCGCLVEARSVFEKIPHPNIVSWSVMILGYAEIDEGEAALEMYAWMRREGVVPDAGAFVAALKACGSLAVCGDSKADLAKKRCMEEVRAIHEDIVKSEFESDILVETLLVDAYAKCGGLLDARHVFDNMPRHDVVSWNVMIMGYAQMEEGGGEALTLYRQMQQEGVTPNHLTFVSALKACSSQIQTTTGRDRSEGSLLVRTQCLEQVVSIHSDVVQGQLEMDELVGNMLVDAYAKCGSLEEARSMFERIPCRNVVSWTAMILGYAQTDQSEEALTLYTRMQQEGVRPNDRTFVSALRACSTLAEKGAAGGEWTKTRCLGQVRAIHSDVVRSGAEAEVFVGTMLVDVYAKCGSLVEARCVFEKMTQRSVVSWNVMIFGYSQMGEGEEALQLFARMQQEGTIQPDDRTFVSALNACGSALRLDKGRELHAQISEKTGRMEAIITDSFVASSLIDMYGKCGSMTEAQQAFEALPRRDAVTWSALIVGYARQGDSEMVFESFTKMKLEGIQPELTTFLIILTVCSHVGLVDKGQDYFECMSRDFGLSPAIQHYTCMVDLLGRSGQLDQAMAMAKNMPFQPDSAVWRTMLGACQKWGNVHLGRQAFQFALALDEDDASSYVLMSNIYAGAGMLDEANQVQAMRTKRMARKEQAQSWWTDTDGNAHTFGAGEGEGHL